MTNLILRAAVEVQSMAYRLRMIQDDERGEGVISAAIAVLIMAFLGAGMWLAFKGMFSDTTDRTTDQVNLIGS